MHMCGRALARVSVDAVAGSGAADFPTSGGQLRPRYPKPRPGRSLLMGLRSSMQQGYPLGAGIDGDEVSVPRPACWDQLREEEGMSAEVGRDPAGKAPGAPSRVSGNSSIHLLSIISQ